jgi:hypothetical protein
MRSHDRPADARHRSARSRVAADLDGRAVTLQDLLDPARYDRDGRELVSGGLFLDLGAWGYHVFEITSR